MALRLVDIARAPIFIYRRFISPMFPASCRHYPTCSSYAMQAYERFGLIRGTYLSVCRLLSCHPWSGRSGYDPVPNDFTWRAGIGYKIGCCCKEHNEN